MTEDPIISVVCWRGFQSQLAARLGIDPARLNGRVKQLGLKRGWTIELEIQSPAAMRTLRSRLTRHEEDS